ncbi:hypothetical protein SK128_022007, partial [Halocaridina rubra]
HYWLLLYLMSCSSQMKHVLYNDNLTVLFHLKLNARDIMAPLYGMMIAVVLKHYDALVWAVMKASRKSSLILPETAGMKFAE